MLVRLSQVGTRYKLAGSVLPFWATACAFYKRSSYEMHLGLASAGAAPLCEGCWHFQNPERTVLLFPGIDS